MHNIVFSLNHRMKLPREARVCWLPPCMYQLVKTFNSYVPYIVLCLSMNRCNVLLTREKLPCQQGGATQWRLPNRFTLVWCSHSNRILYPLAWYKLVGLFPLWKRFGCFWKEYLICVPYKCLGFYFCIFCLCLNFIYSKKTMKTNIS